MRIIRLLIFALLFSATPLVAQQYEGHDLVKATLISDAASVKSGEPFRVGVQFKIYDKWHLYWKNAGDAGLPIDIKLTLPEGFTQGEMQFPTPHKFVENGIVAYGYSNEVVVFTSVVPPKDFATNKPVAISAKANWLVCESVCIPGNATLSLTTGKATADAAKSLFDKYAAQLPQPLSAAGLSVEKVSASSVQANGQSQVVAEIVLAGSGAAGVTDFFPEAFDQFSVNHIDVKVSNGKITLPLTPNSKTATLAVIKGLAIIGEKGYDLTATLPAVPPTPASKGSSGFLNQDFNVQGQKTEGLPLALVLLLAFVGGLILNVMPCVLPVLSLKVMSFVQQKDKSEAENKKLGLVFAAGVLVSFLALAAVAILLRAAGETIGWGFQFQSPAFVVAMTTVVFVFGINLLGVFEFGTPAVSGSAAQTLSKNGSLGAFANGVLATTLATPCTAPFLGTALGFAFSQPAWVILAVFTVVAIGMALPYVVLAWSPALLKFVPKPGLWMVKFKQLMGFLLLATAAWLLSVVGSQLGMEGVVYTLAFLLAVAFAAWVIENYAGYGSAGVRKAVVWSVAAAIVGGVYAWGFESKLDWRHATQTVSSAKPADGGIVWQPFTLASVESEVSSGKTVFIDFTADWCFTCKVTEKTVLQTDAVRSKIKELGIVPMQADWTNHNDEIAQILKKFGRSGVPLYVVFPAGKPTEPIVLPEVITQELLLDAFAKATAKPTASR
jgi:thiol:disulfide interchange protein